MATTSPGPCLSPDDCLHYLHGSVTSPPATEAQRHLDVCDACRAMMSEAVRDMMEAQPAVRNRGFRTLEDGELVAGRYEIRRFVARGGMGEVYEAVDTALNERIALKTLAIALSDQVEAAEALLREVRIARKIIHPNVCRILELGVHQRAGAAAPLPFLTMEYLNGETLARRLARLGRMPPLDVLRMVKDMAAGLSAAYQAGIVHRDFKTENVFLTDAGDDGSMRVVVMDFGLARAFEGPLLRRSSNANANASGKLLVGTPAYMAPEQLTGQAATPVTDVYALGIVTFEMLTGQLPFSGESLAAVALSRLHQSPVAPSKLVGGLAFGWDAWIARCLEREPNRRFSSVRAATEALDNIGNTRPARERPVWRFLAAAVLVGTLVSGPGATVVRSSKVQQTELSPGGAEPAAATKVPDREPETSTFSWTKSAESADIDAKQEAPETGLQAPAPLITPRAQRGARRIRPAHAGGERNRQGDRAATSPAEVVTGAPGSPGTSSAETTPLTPPSRSRPRHPDDLIDPFAPAP